MDPVISSLFPVHQIGSDGFNWWIGQVEDTEDKKKGARYKVRIVGQHLKECDIVPTEELPWASVMMPVTTPFSDGGVTGASSNLRPGNWVIGFYLDNDKQKPIIMGSIGHTPGSTKVINSDPNPGGKCKSFTTFIDEEVNPATDFPANEPKGTAAADNEAGYEEGSNITGAEPTAATRAAEKGGLPPSLLGAFGQNSETNTTGGKFCVAIANPNCGAEKGLKSNLTRIIGEMMAANQQSGGQLGDFYVNKATGALNDQLSTGRYHINRVVRLVKSSVARAKGEIIAELKNGAKELIDFTLYETETQVIPDDIDKPLTGAQLDAIEAADIAYTEALESGNLDAIEAADIEYTELLGEISGERGHPTVKKKKSRIKGIQDFLDNALKEIGCSIADITDRLAQWLTDLLLGYIQDAFNAAACLIDELVNGILNEILGYIDALINDILGGLQNILSSISQPLNIIGNILKRVMDILGISCSGPEAQCEKIQIKCTDCGTQGENQDDLDKLIRAVEDGNLDFSNNICDDATKWPDIIPTGIIFVGGIPLPVTPSSPPSGSGGTTGGVPATTTGSISYESSDITVAEGAKAIFTITRSGAITSSSSIKYKVTGGTATSSTDYAALTGGTIAFAPGEASKNIEFDTFSDSIAEGSEYFEIKIEEDVTPATSYATFPKGDLFICTITDTATPLSPSTVPFTPGAIPPPVVSPSAVTGAVVAASPIPLVPSYAVTVDVPFVNEGDIVNFIITTSNVADGTVLTYTLSGTNITASDIVAGSLTGSFTVVGGTATVPVEIAVNDDDIGTTDAAEDLVFTIDTTTASAVATINGEASTTPSYAVTADKTSVNEGDEIVYTISTINVPDGTILNYTLSGTNITSSDIVGGLLNGSVTINSDTAIEKITIASDGVIETAEVLTFSIDTTLASVDVIINPTSTLTIPASPVATPTYNVSTDKLIYKEGENIIYTINTTNVIDGSTFTYKLFGTNIKESDFILEALTGNFTVTGNTSTVIVGIKNDLEIEGNETVTFSIDGTGASADVVIEGEVIEIPSLDPTTPCLKKPIASAITDSKGKIISISVDDKGCPYAVKPEVIITGAGYGAAAIPLLDANGFVSEVRLVRTGINYKPAPPINLNCIIDSFTMLRPGSGYTSSPTVYVNGNDKIARAIIENGTVISVEILDRTITFNELPTVKIVGGGGYGAKFLPSLSCLEITELERRGYAKIGTGKYIDCP